MSNLRKSFTLILIFMMSASSLSLLIAKPVFAQSSFSPTPTPYEQTFDYRLPNGYTITYEIGSSPTGYLIALSVMDNPPIEINLYEQLPNETENRVTKNIAYGMTIGSTSYPTNITFTELSNEPTSTPTSTDFTTSSPTPASPTSTPTIPEFPTWIIPSLFALMVVLASALVYFKSKSGLDMRRSFALACILILSVSSLSLLMVKPAYV